MAERRNESGRGTGRAKGGRSSEARHLKQLRALSALSADIARRCTPEDFLPALIETVRAELGYAHVSLFRIDPDADELVLEAAAGPYTPSLQPGDRRPVGTGIIGHAARAGEAYVAQDTSTDALVRDGEPDGGRRPRAELAAPIRADGKVLGVLRAAANKPNAFDEGDVEILKTLGDVIGLAIDNARLAEDARRAQRQRIHAERTATVGQLIAGLAHEINNPLAAVHSGIELLLSERQTQGIAETLEVIRSEAHRASAIVENLLDIGCLHEPTEWAISVEEVLDAALRLRSHEHAVQEISILRDLPPLPPVRVDPYRLQQVFLNLIVNAEQAMAGQPTPRVLAVRAARIDDDVEVRFSDSGPGIPEGQIERIFDPFFTTGDAGAGKGFGLGVSLAILRDLGGRIWVESEPGRGAVFVIRIPAVRPCASGSTEAEAPSADTDTAATPPALAILFVDDEASIREMAARYLRRIGYTVEVAGDGEEALRLLESRRFDVIVTDLKMPGLGGEELYRRIEALPAAAHDRVLFISGDVMGDRTRAFLNSTGRPYLTKPFELKELARRVREVAGQPQT